MIANDQVNEMMRWADKDGDGKVSISIFTLHSRSHMTSSGLDKLAIITSFGRSVLHKVPFDSKGRVALPNRMNFRKSSKGGGHIFNPKIYIPDFGPLYRALKMGFRKNCNISFRK